MCFLTVCLSSLNTRLFSGYMCVLWQALGCLLLPRTTICVRPHYYICVLVLLYSFYYICVFVLLYMCPLPDCICVIWLSYCMCVLLQAALGSLLMPTPSGSFTLSLSKPTWYNHIYIYKNSCHRKGMWHSLYRPIIHDLSLLPVTPPTIYIYIYYMGLRPTHNI